MQCWKKIMTLFVALIHSAAGIIHLIISTIFLFFIINFYDWFPSLSFKTLEVTRPPIPPPKTNTVCLSKLFKPTFIKNKVFFS